VKVRNYTTAKKMEPVRAHDMQAAGLRAGMQKAFFEQAPPDWKCVMCKPNKYGQKHCYYNIKTRQAHWGWPGKVDEQKTGSETRDVQGTTGSHWVDYSGNSARTPTDTTTETLLKECTWE
jgi:hypothetical protein